VIERLEKKKLIDRRLTNTDILENVMRRFGNLVAVGRYYLAG